MLVELGKKQKACPYYGTRYAVPAAQVCVYIDITVEHFSLVNLFQNAWQNLKKN